MRWLWQRIRHGSWRDDLSAYADGELDAARTRLLATHLTACEICQQELAELRATRNLVQQLPQVRAPRSFALESSSQVEAPTRYTTTPLVTIMRGATIAAIGALAILLAADFVSVSLPDAGEEERAAPAFDAQRSAQTPLAAPAAQPGGATESERLAGPSPMADAPQFRPEDDFALDLQSDEPSSDALSILRIAEVALGASVVTLGIGWLVTRRRISNT